MTLEILNESNIKALKSGDKLARSVLTNIIANIKNAAINERCEITSELCDRVINKELKIINEMIDSCPVERADLLAEYAQKKAVICKYAPKLIDNEDEIREMVIDIIYKANVTDTNRIMKTVMPQLKGKVDMKVANKVITEMIKRCEFLQ